MESRAVFGLTLFLMLSWMFSCIYGLVVLNGTEFEKLLTGKDVQHPDGWKSLMANPGDVVRVVAPAGKGAQSSLPLIKNYVESLGLVADISLNIYNQSEPFYSNSDEFRASDLISALLNDTVKVIWCIRGGSGTMRLIPYLEERLPETLPQKILIGYSDITVLHLYLANKYGWQTLHGPMLEGIVTGQYDPIGSSVVSLTDLIFDRRQSICLPQLTMLDENTPVAGIQSQVVGGNLALVEASIGTLWQVNASGKILFLEDTGEAAYSVERSLDHMKQAGVFKLVDAVIFGDFTGADSTTLMNLALKRFAQSVSFSVFRMAGIGHGSVNYPLPLSTFTEIVRIDSDTYHFCVNNILGQNKPMLNK